jgi:hypothetical protein
MSVPTSLENMVRFPRLVLFEPAYEDTATFDMSVTIYQSTQPDFLADFGFHYRCENLQYVILQLDG